MAKNIIARDFSLENPNDENFDIYIDSNIGDFHISDNSNQEHSDSLFRAFKGEYRIKPTLGIGIQRNLNGTTNRIKIEREVREGMLLDNFDVEDVKIIFDTDGLNISTNANRKK
tara:strand:+ start:6822 stop:7163 length:342 start_codon:yes stop_codon:yes gene_type:complete